MDLLGGYGSSSDDEGKSVSNETPNEPQAQPQSTADIAPTSNATQQPSQKGTATAARRAKKLLSLQAVVPKHIWDELNTHNEKEEDDDDEEDSVEQARRKKASKPKQTVQRSHDPQLSRLLNDLHNTESTTATKKSKASRPSSNPKQESQPLGTAFLTSTTVTIRKSKNQVDEKEETIVRDIHGEESSALVGGVETVVESDDEDFIQLETKALAPRDAPPKRRVQAAPSVAPRPPAPSATASAIPPMAHISEESMETDTTPIQSVSQLKQQKRHKRKEMERMLRHGNIGDAARDDSMIAANLQAPDHTHQANIPQAEPSVPQHGVRAVPTQMYNPSAGMTTAGVRGRGKNQINQLLGQAANLELERARAAGVGAPKQTIHRANAKRKYGW